MPFREEEREYRADEARKLKETESEGAKPNQSGKMWGRPAVLERRKYILRLERKSRPG